MFSFPKNQVAEYFSKIDCIKKSQSNMVLVIRLSEPGQYHPGNRFHCQEPHISTDLELVLEVRGKSFPEWA